MLLVQVVAAAVCAAGLVWFSGVWRRGEPRGGAVSVPQLNSRLLQVSAGLGATVLLVLLLVPEAGVGSPAALVDFSYVAPLQYAAPVVAALVAMLGVPLALKQPAGQPRVSNLRPRILTEFIDRPTRALVGPPLGASAILACMVWQLLSSVPILWESWTPTSSPSKRVEISERILGFPLTWQELIGLGLAEAVLSIAAWTVLRRIRDAPAMEHGELGAHEVTVRRMLARYVLSTTTAAQTALAGLSLLSAGQFLQDAETTPVLRFLRQEVAGKAYRLVGINRLQPEWSLATIEVVLGAALLVVALAAAWQAFRVLHVLSVRRRAAALAAAA